MDCLTGSGEEKAWTLKPVENMGNLKPICPTLGTRVTQVLQGISQERFGERLCRAVYWTQRKETGVILLNPERVGQKRQLMIQALGGKDLLDEFVPSL